MRHTLSIIVADQPGELSRIVGLFSARGFNIETISVGETLRLQLVTRHDCHEWRRQSNPADRETV